MTIDLADALPRIEELAAAQGEILLQQWPRLAPVHHAAGERDISTAIDVEVEQGIRNRLRDLYPDHGIRGEEMEDEGRDREYTWSIDPIDGTKFYAARSSLFSISIALLHRDEPVLGVVRDVTSGQSFSAIQGGGAYVDGCRLVGSSVVDLAQAIVHVDGKGTEALPDDERAWCEERLLRLTRRVYRVRSLGQGSLAACWLASGAFDAFADLTGYDTTEDLAAGRIVMRESGAQVEYIEAPAGPKRLLAAPPALWEPLAGVLLG